MQQPIKDILDIGPNCYERFISNSILADMPQLSITLAGCSNLSGQYCVARSAPLEHTLFYTLQGRGKLVTQDQEYTLEAHSLAILPSRHGFRISIDAPRWDIFWLNLKDCERWKNVRVMPPQVVLNQKLEAMHAALELLYQESQTHLTKGVTPIISHYLNVILLNKQRGQANHRLSQLFQEIDKRLQYSWTIESMCEHIHYSAPHLHRLCLRHYGKSPIQQLIHLRIERAKNLLLNTQWSVQHIANYVGYESVFSFSKSFKKHSTLSPSAYRGKNV